MIEMLGMKESIDLGVNSYRNASNHLSFFQRLADNNSTIEHEEWFQNRFVSALHRKKTKDVESHSKSFWNSWQIDGMSVPRSRNRLQPDLSLVDFIELNYFDALATILINRTEIHWPDKHSFM